MSTATATNSQAGNETFLKTTNTDQFSVDYRLVQPEEGFNHRILSNYGDMEGLALSVCQFGIIEAILGFRKNGLYIITEGHRRKLAVEMAHQYHKDGKAGFEDISKIERIPFKISSSNKLDRLLIMGITGQGKQPLTDLEKARLYEAVISEYAAKGLKRTEAINEIVDKMGVSQAAVYNILKLNKLPEEIKTYIAEGSITGATVTNIIREVKDPTEQIKVVEKTIKAAQDFAEKNGSTKKAATQKDAKGLVKPKSIKEKLANIKEILEENGDNNVRAKAFLELMTGLEKNTKVKELAALFQ